MWYTGALTPPRCRSQADARFCLMPPASVDIPIQRCPWDVKDVADVTWGICFISMGFFAHPPALHKNPAFSPVFCAGATSVHKGSGNFSCRSCHGSRHGLDCSSTLRALSIRASRAAHLSADASRSRASKGGVVGRRARPIHGHHHLARTLSLQTPAALAGARQQRRRANDAYGVCRARTLAQILALPVRARLAPLHDMPPSKGFGKHGLVAPTLRTPTLRAFQERGRRHRLCTAAQSAYGLIDHFPVTGLAALIQHKPRVIPVMALNLACAASLAVQAVLLSFPRDEHGTRNDAFCGTNTPALPFIFAYRSLHPAFPEDEIAPILLSSNITKRPLASPLIHVITSTRRRPPLHQRCLMQVRLCIARALTPPERPMLRRCPFAQHIPLVELLKR